MSIIQLSPQLHHAVNIFKKLGIQADLNISKHESELIKKSFDDDSNDFVEGKPELRDWW
jgi:hypothetical protein